MELERLITSGRKIEGPTADLVELHQDGQVYTALCHHTSFQRASLIDDLLHDCRPFLEDPTVEGIVELDAWESGTHRLVYPTSRIWTLAELLRGVREADARLGLRAGLELGYVVGSLLQDGHAAGDDLGAPFHGDLSPWRIVFDDEADLHLLGWGVPPLALYRLDRDPSAKLPREVFQYCPPERLRAEDEDLSTDLFSLGLVMVEAITGHPLYGGLEEEVRHQADHADTERRLHRVREELPEDVLHFLGRVLDPYRDARHDDVDDFLVEVHGLLYAPYTDDLPTLADCLSEHRARAPRLPRIPDEAAPKWTDPFRSRQRWASPRRSGTHRRPTHEVADPEQVTPLTERKARPGPASAAQALRERMSRSQNDREAILQARLGRSSANVPRAAVRDRNGLFPREPLRGELMRTLVELPSGGTVWTRLAADETLALSAARIADKACPTPVDATGRLMGWYRIEQGGSGWFGDTKTSVLKAGEPVTLAFVPNRVVGVELVLEDHEDAPVKLDVGTAVHVQFLLSHLRQRFELRARDWELWLEDGRPLDRWQILDDYDPDDGIVLRMKRARSARRSLRRR